MIARRSVAIPLASLALLAAACSSPQRSFEDQRPMFHARSGHEAFRRGDFQGASLHFERSLEYARALGDGAAEANALIDLGSTFHVLGQPERARELYAQAAAALEGLDPPHRKGEYALALNRSRLALAQDEPAAAADLLAEARAAAADLDDRAVEAHLRKQEAAVLAEQGQAEAAIEAAADAERLFAVAPRRPDTIAGDADAHLLMARLLLERGDATGAIAQFKQAERTAREVSDRTLIALALEGEGDALLLLGRRTDAALPLHRALLVNERLPHEERALRVRAKLQAIEADRED